MGLPHGFDWGRRLALRTPRRWPNQRAPSSKLQTNGANFTILRQFSNDDGAFRKQGCCSQEALSTGPPAAAAALESRVQNNFDGTDFVVAGIYHGHWEAVIHKGGWLWRRTPYAERRMKAQNKRGAAFCSRYGPMACSFGQGFFEVDGLYQTGDLLLDGNVLYGTTISGDAKPNGTVSKLILMAVTTKCCDFSDQIQGAPWSGVLQIGSTLYGAHRRAFELWRDGFRWRLMAAVLKCSKDFADYSSDGAFPVRR